MYNTTKESDDRMMNKDHTDSPPANDVSSEGNLVGTEPLKKGPWTLAEDAILVDYVNRHGEGNWNNMQRYSELSRCGKSCRLRWANHLKPDLKKGKFTMEEERRIVELHAKMGNKWARMAAELPGRTDNEIKNYWHTRIKKRQHAGLPIYPPDVCPQTMNESQPSQSIGINHANLFQANNFGIPDVEFKNLELNQGFLSHLPTYFDASASCFLAQGIGSYQSNSFMYPTMHPPEVLQQSETIFPSSNGSVSNIWPEFSRYERVGQTFRLFSPHEAGLNAIDSSSNIHSGFHASLDVNSSSSMPISEAAKSELPSFQYSETQLGSWVAPPSPLPSRESVDTFIQSLPTEKTQSQCLSPPNSGLLEEILYESQLKNSKKNLSQQTSSSSALPGDVVDSSLWKIFETGWEEYTDPISPLGYSSASMVSEYNPISGSSPNEPQSFETMPGCKVELENYHSVFTQYDRRKEVPTRPDTLLGSNLFSCDTGRVEDQVILEDALAALKGENMSSDNKEMGGHGFDTWDSMSSVSDTENH